MALFTLPLIALLMFGLLNYFAQSLYQMAEDKGKALTPKQFGATVLLIALFI